jgi:putative toxin-antitoxin system antitoxin component (TIGR02293 family)
MICRMAEATFSNLTEENVRNGVQVASLAALGSALDLSTGDLLDWLQISPRTWARRKHSGVFDLLESDRVARLSRLLRRAAQVLGGPIEARDWLMTPNRALGRRSPFDVAGTEVGAEGVFGLLGRLEHGVFS